MFSNLFAFYILQNYFYFPRNQSDSCRVRKKELLCFFYIKGNVKYDLGSVLDFGDTTVIKTYISAGGCRYQTNM